MRNLQFVVEGQKLSPTGDFSGIVRGTKNYLRCQFKFVDTDWSGMVVAAVFEKRGIEYPVLIDSNRTCVIPEDVTSEKSFRLNLIGKTGNRIIKTNKLLLSQEG